MSQRDPRSRARDSWPTEVALAQLEGCPLIPLRRGQGNEVASEFLISKPTSDSPPSSILTQNMEVLMPHPPPPTRHRQASLPRIWRC